MGETLSTPAVGNSGGLTLREPLQQPYEDDHTSCGGSGVVSGDNSRAAARQAPPTRLAPPSAAPPRPPPHQQSRIRVDVPPGAPQSGRGGGGGGGSGFSSSDYGAGGTSRGRGGGGGGGGAAAATPRGPPTDPRRLPVAAVLPRPLQLQVPAFCGAGRQTDPVHIPCPAPGGTHALAPTLSPGGILGSLESRIAAAEARAAEAGAEAAAARAAAAEADAEAESAQRVLAEKQLADRNRPAASAPAVAGGLFRTSTRPTLNLLLLLCASV